MPEEDAQLVESALEGDQDAFQKLILAYQTKVVTLLTRMLRDRENALDMSQEVFLKAYRGLDKLKDSRKFGSWIMQMAHNRGLDFLKRRRPKTLLTDFGDQKTEQLVSDHVAPRPEEDPASMVERFGHPEVLQVLDELDIKYRTILILRFMEGYPFQKIADILDLPLSTVKFRKFYAIKLMKRLMLERQQARRSGGSKSEAGG
jgi:RNA polymerase sigma-70 factor (ECF subfamily)